MIHRLFFPTRILLVLLIARPSQTGTNKIRPRFLVQHPEKIPREMAQVQINSQRLVKMVGFEERLMLRAYNPLSLNIIGKAITMRKVQIEEGLNIAREQPALPVLTS